MGLSLGTTRWKRTVLAGVRQVGPIVQRLLAGSHSTIAGRLAGAFRDMGCGAFADEIGRAMRNTEHDSFRETNPFAAPDSMPATSGQTVRRSESAIIDHLRTLWDTAREPVLLRGTGCSVTSTRIPMATAAWRVS